MAWQRLNDQDVWNRLGTITDISRGGFNFTPDPKYNSPNPGAPTPFNPDLKMANDAQRNFANSRNPDPMANQADSINNYGWTGQQPYGMSNMGTTPNSSTWDQSVPEWARNAYEYSRATSLPDSVANTQKYSNNPMQTTTGFAAPPHGYQSPTNMNNRLVFGPTNANFLNGSGITLPQGDWNTASIDYSHPNWWNPQSGAWRFGRLEKDNDMGGLGMIGSLGGALMGFGFSPPVLSMMGGGGVGVNPSLQATQGPIPASSTNSMENPARSAVSNQLVQQSAASRAATAQQRAQQRASTQRGLFNLGAITNYRR